MTLAYISGSVGGLATLKGSPNPITANLRACYQVQRNSIRQLANPINSASYAVGEKCSWRTCSQVCEGTRQPGTSGGRAIQAAFKVPSVPFPAELGVDHGRRENYIRSKIRGMPPRTANRKR